MYLLFLQKTDELKRYFFVNGSFIYDAKFPTEFKTIDALKKTAKNFQKRIPFGYEFHYIKSGDRSLPESTPYKRKRKAPVKRRGKNPVPYSKAAKIKKAIENFENFTGHSPEYIDKKNLPQFEVGFKIGMCDGIMYTTVRDGKTERYIHKFKSRARPILAVNFDGSSISLIDGHYRFTEQGIIDT